jgi:very-short-patch-repair endonuclease
MKKPRKHSTQLGIVGLVDNKPVPDRRVQIMNTWTKRRLNRTTYAEKVMGDALGVVTRFMQGQIRVRREHPIHLFANMARALDFFIGQARIGIEVDGRNHSLGAQARKDVWTDELLLKHGDILIIRFLNEDVTSNIHDVVARIVTYLRDRREWPKSIIQDFDKLITHADTKETWHTLCFEYTHEPTLKPAFTEPKPEPVKLTYRQLRSLPLADQVAHVMSTHAWTRLRRKIRKERGFKCEDCKQSQNVSLELWHLTYDRIGSERTSDMLYLCKRCRKLRSKIKQS